MAAGQDFDLLAESLIRAAGEILAPLAAELCTDLELDRDDVDKVGDKVGRAIAVAMAQGACLGSIDVAAKCVVAGMEVPESFVFRDITQLP